tara:strand:+ start:228 stop:356 length:129 start_codon:yes stop_codon:yes gene_type:complete
MAEEKTEVSEDVSADKLDEVTEPVKVSKKQSPKATRGTLDKV